MDIVALILGVIGAATLFIYFVRWPAYSPKTFIRVGGEERGEPIVVESQGKIYWAVGTESRHQVSLPRISVSWNDDEVQLSAPGGEKQLTTDNVFPLELVFTDPRTVTRRHLQATYVRYTPKKDLFTLRFGAISRVEEAERTFLFDMFGPPKSKAEREVRFRVDPKVKLSLQEAGLRVGPGESLHVEGVQAQDAVWAAAEKGEVKVKVREVLKE